MIGTWAIAVPAIVAATLLAVLPGLIVALCAGFRRFGALGIAPLLSAGVLGISAIAAPYIGIGWGVLAVSVGTAVAGALAAAARWIRSGTWFRQNGPLGARSVDIAMSLRWTTTLGVLVPAAVIGVRCLYVFGSPEYVSQTADNIFHLNAVRYILDHHSGSSLGLGATDGGSASFYPGAWHDLVSLVTATTGASIPVAVAASNLVIAAILWPLSAIYAARVFFGNQWIVDISAGFLAASFSAFPFLNLNWGVLYPNFYGIAVVPALIGLVRSLLRLPLGRSAPAFVILLLGAAGAALAHPNTILTTMVVVVPMVFAKLSARARSRANAGSRREALTVWILVIGFGAVSACIWILLRPFPISSYTITWPPFEDSAQATGEFLLSSYGGSVGGFAVALPTIAGLLLFALRKPWRWLATSYAIWGVLFVTVASVDPSPLRAFLTGGWYDDAHRIAAGSVTVCLLLGVGAFRFISVALRLRLRRRADPRAGALWPRTISHALVAAAASLAVVLAQSTNVAEAADAAAKNYNLTSGSPLMSADEQHLYQELPHFVPSDDVVANNPWDGSAWAYMESGTKVLFPHVLSRVSADALTLAQRLNEADSDPAVCDAVRRLHAYYAINSDELIYLPGNPQNAKYPGISGLDKAPGFSLVTAVGKNRLYKVTACGTPR